MHVAGIHTQVVSGRAVVRFVVLERTGTDWIECRKFIHACGRDDELPQQMLDLADDMAHQLAGLDLRAVVLRDRDHHAGRVNPQQLKIDHTADGVVLAAVRRVCADTRMLPGAAIGELCGSDKATAEANAAVEFGPSFREAGAAARAAAAIAP